MRSMSILGSPGLLCAGLVMGGSVVLAQGSAFAASAPSCVSAQMVVTHGQAQGTARTTYIPLVFTNKGRACAIWGVPAVNPSRERTTLRSDPRRVTTPWARCPCATWSPGAPR